MSVLLSTPLSPKDVSKLVFFYNSYSSLHTVPDMLDPDESYYKSHPSPTYLPHFCHQ